MDSTAGFGPADGGSNPPGPIKMYAIEKIQQKIREEISRVLNIDEKEIRIDAFSDFGDFSVPLFKILKSKNLSMEELEKILKENVKISFFDKFTFENGYMNFHLNINSFVDLVFKDLKKFKEKYGKQSIGKGKKVLIDYSSPNIGKPLSVSHLRSTIIGDSLYRIFSFLGYKVIRVNHLGDWGLQYGELIYAYLHWLDKKNFKKNPIEELLRLYVKFNEEAKNDPKLLEEARKTFAKLEKGDKKLKKIWEKLRNVSLKEFKRMYKLLGVEFDYYLGESFYVQEAKKLIKELKQRGIAKEKEGLVLIELPNLNPLIIQKSDESTLYATRDLAAGRYRIKRWAPEEILYVVGNDQKYYFQQLFSAFKILNYPCNFEHINFGLILFRGKLSTRRGKIIFLEEIIREAVEKAKELIKINVSEKEREEIAEKIGIGAVKFNDLSQDREKDIDFSFEKILNMEGKSCPYVQYTYVRALSVLRKARKMRNVKPVFKEKEEIELIKKLALFPEIIKEAAKVKQPYLIANYLYDLSKNFHKFYETIPILKSKERDRRLMLVKFVSVVIKNGLYLLGINVVDRM